MCNKILKVSLYLDIVREQKKSLNLSRFREYNNKIRKKHEVMKTNGRRKENRAV